MRRFIRSILFDAVLAVGLVRPVSRHRARPQPARSEHVGATVGYAAILHELQSVAPPPELAVDDPLIELRHARVELEVVDRAIAEFTRRVDVILTRFIGPLDQTGELDLVALERLLADGRELAVA